MALTANQQRFVELIILGSAPVDAYRGAYPNSNAKPTTATREASKLLVHPTIAPLIAQAREKAKERVMMTASDVADMWAEAATCDRNELMEVRRPCCRYCWSDDHSYQMTPAEFRARLEAHNALLRATPEKEWARLPPAPVPGKPFDRRKDPNPDCPECWGDGDMVVMIKDTRKLPRGARQLYEGVKITKDGVELKVMDRGKAIENMAKHLGMMIDRKVLMNPDGTPIDMKPVSVNFIAVKAGG